jgi:hypothetical protein
MGALVELGPVTVMLQKKNAIKEWKLQIIITGGKI